MRRCARQMRNDYRQGEEDIIQWQAGLDPGRNDRDLFDGRQHRTSPLFGPIGSSATVERERHFFTVFSLIP